tara:strand:- start:41 stop:232 length:192 start_codon:yes stop_codon:yes gene_type:complete
MYNEHDTLAENFATRLVDDMDMGTLVQIAIENLTDYYRDEYTLEQLKTEIEDNGCYDDLLENL